MEFVATPLLVMLTQCGCVNPKLQSLPIKAYEPTIEVHERKSRNVYVEISLKIETGEAERIAVDWTARDGAGGGSCKSPRSCPSERLSDKRLPHSFLIVALVVSHLQTQRAAIQMLQSRISVLVKYVSSVLAGKFTSCFLHRPPTQRISGIGESPKDNDTLRSLTALVASLPASENKGFREEFDTVRIPFWWASLPG